MSSKKTEYGTEDVKCPFFQCHEPKVIVCEGITDDSVIRLWFKHNRGRNAQEDIFCKCAYEKCEIYMMLMMFKYGD